MTFWLKERLIVRKYSTEWNTLQAFLTIGAKTTIVINFSPPSGKFFLIMYGSIGKMVLSTLLTYTIYIDGTLIDSNSSSGALQQYPTIRTPVEIVHNNLNFILTNNDTIPHEIDFQLFGFNIQTDKLSEFTSEIIGETDRKILTQILDELKALNARPH